MEYDLVRTSFASTVDITTWVYIWGRRFNLTHSFELVTRGVYALLLDEISMKKLMDKMK